MGRQALPLVIIGSARGDALPVAWQPAAAAGARQDAVLGKWLSVNRNEACAFCHMPELSSGMTRRRLYTASKIVCLSRVQESAVASHV